LWHNRAWQSPYKLNVEDMREAAGYLVGTHDFKGFCASGSEVKTTVRTIYRIDVTQSGEQIIFDFYGNGFLYNMVRILVGTLSYVGQGRIAAGDIPEILASCDRKRAGITAPACGLYMARVYYSKRFISFLKPVQWPRERYGWKMHPEAKIKKLQLSHACHVQSRVFARKNGKIQALDGWEKS
jgi:tRNA U38,U39,U40 pseudouridine synthase TruA